MSVDGLEWMGARVYDPAARGFLSVDPLDPVVGAGWAGNPYAFAGNDPLHAVDPSGLSPVTDAQLQAYRDSNGIGGAVKTVANAVNTVNDSITDWAKNNWEYVAGGAMVVGGAALMATGVVGPAGMMLISAGADTIIQKATTGEVNWGQVAVSGAAGAVGFGVGGALAKTAMSTGAKTVVANVAEGAVSSGAGYLTGPGPHTVGGLAKNTGFGAATGGVPMRGAAGRELSEGGGRLLSHADEVATACFVAGTPVLLADGTTKPVEDVAVGDEVTAFNPDTGTTETRRVVDAFVHHDVPTYDVVIDDDQSVTTTAEHPFMVVGQGWTPVRELRKGDLLLRPDGTTVTIHSVDATGDTATVHNFEVEDLHNYYVQAGDQWILVHNTCGVGAAEATAPARFITTSDGVTIDRSSVSERLSVQRQARHIVGDEKYNNGSYFSSIDDARGVLSGFHDGSAQVLGVKGNDIVVRTPEISGVNHNPRSGYPHQPTDVHFIKGTTSPSVVPTNPAWGS